MFGALLGAMACGGSPKEAPDPAAPFVGTWTIQMGTVVTSCPDAGPGEPDGGFSYSQYSSSSTFSPDVVAITFAESSPTELVETQTGVACHWNWTVSGGVATMTGANTCADDSSDPVGNSATFLSTPLDRATLSGGTLTEVLGGSVVILDSGQSFTCGYSGSIQLAQE